MKYRDLVQFDPIYSVVELRKADQRDRAEELVRTYVFSDDIAERLERIVFPHLQFEKPADNKGLMVVGNYGTGKSHLLAVISTVAEHADAVLALQDSRVANAAAPVAGRFKVIRSELGSTMMDFREFVCREIEAALAAWGIEFRFPAYNQVGNHKLVFDEMMAAFAEVFPNQGLLFVLDELLDYLRTRRGQDLTRDLGFLRELGEICQDTRFRFIAGLQEMLFDNPAFESQASAARRVMERVEQVLIHKRDVKHVVAQRLLHKTPDQQARVREYLEPFASSYGRMNERMDEYVRLFPVHPDFIDTFENLSFIEHREVLKALSNEMEMRLDNEIPADRPGLIANDTYWQRIKDNSVLRAVPEIKEVLDCHAVLESRIEQGFGRPQYRDMALRLVAALAVHRLTTRDVYSPIGATAEELRDSLCLYDPFVAEMGGDPADDLASQIVTVLNEVIKTVSGQFISLNKDNRQYHLDLRKTEDFDAIIDRRIEALGREALDDAYFSALKRVLEKTDQPTLAGLHETWEHEVTWLDRKVTRIGYLFFGAPSQRDTAIPPREAYLYFIAPYNPPRFTDEKRKDEVMFRLKHPDAGFETDLKRYAAASALASTASLQAKQVYIAKANESLKNIVRWLQQHILSAVEATYQGRSATIQEWLKKTDIRQMLGLGANQTANPADYVNLAASVCFSEHFDGLAPEHPQFSQLFTERSRASGVADALRQLRGDKSTKTGRAVLDALELLDGEKLAPRGSRYAKYVLDLLAQKGAGQVVNRSELIGSVNGVEYVAPVRFRMHPEWLTVVLAALVSHAEIVLTLPGQEFKATDLETLVSQSPADLAAFKHVKLPQGWNVPGLTAAVRLVSLSDGVVAQIQNGDEEAIRQFGEAMREKSRALAEAAGHVHEGMKLWGKPLLSEEEASAYARRISTAKSFIESLQSFNTVGRLKNFPHAPEAVAVHAAGFTAAREVTELHSLAGRLGPLTVYLGMAVTELPDGNPVTAQIREAQAAMTHDLSDPKKRGDAAYTGKTVERLMTLKNAYYDEYVKLLRRARLDKPGDGRRQQILSSPAMTKMEALKGIDILPAGQLQRIKDDLACIRMANVPSREDMNVQPVFAGFHPTSEHPEQTATARLDEIATRVEATLEAWTGSLLEALDGAKASGRLKLLPSNIATKLEPVMAAGKLPDTIDQSFVAAVREALKELKGVTIPREAFIEKLFAGGAPVTPDELRRRLDLYLAEITDGTPADQVRIMLDS